MNRNQKLALSIIILIGVMVPFIQYFVIIEMFYLLIPFAIIFIATLIYLIFSLLNKDFSSKKGFFIFSIIPIFILSQLASGFIIDKLQRFRSNRIISEIENIKVETGLYPDEYNLRAGIEYYKIKTEENFVIKYSRGFMVTEKYQSKYKHWRSYGWSD